MSRAKIAVATSIALLALLAVGSASASAAGWNVNKTALGSGSSAELAKGTTTVTNFELSLIKSQIIVTCTGIQNNEADIVGTSLFTAKSLLLTGCTSNAANCPVASTIPTTEVQGTVTPGTPDTIKIEPVAGPTKLIMTVEFTGPLCALEGQFPVSGNFTVSAPDLGTEQAEHELTVSSSELKSGSSPDALAGSAKFKLASGDEWGFH